MKLFFRKIFNFGIFKKIRNTIGFHPEYFNIPKSNNFSLSDTFAWRTDENFSTIFRYTDIPKLIYGKEISSVILKFYDHNKFLYFRYTFALLIQF